MALSSIMTACAYSAPASRASPASPQNVERPGWGFAKHGGFPPLPWGASGRPQDSTAVYFAGNASGLNNASEAAAQARFGMIFLNAHPERNSFNSYHGSVPATVAACRIAAVGERRLEPVVCRTRVPGHTDCW